MRARREELTDKARTGVRVRSWLVLFSLFVQLIAISGHFHPEDFAFLYEGSGEAAALAGPRAQGGANLPGGSPGVPAHDECSLCFNLQLAQSSALPQPIALAPPRQQQTAQQLPRVPRHSPNPYFLFQTRAPPVI
jgi:hypothetical protein